MTEGNFSERCADTGHVWEEFEGEDGVYTCKNCLTYARPEGSSMRVIMCAEPGCSSPAEMYMRDKDAWVCDRHFVGVYIL
jgi:predicted SAM-dependent methyltransferase